MKKLLFLALSAGALLVASCSSEEAIDVPRDAGQISFQVSTNKHSRAVAGDAMVVDSLKASGFNVSAYSKTAANGPNTGTQVLDNAAVTFASGKWGYSPVAYWIKNTNYKFSAVSHAQQITGMSTADDGYGSVNFTNTGNKDLIWATATRTTADINAQPAAVDFSFKHALCRVKFSFQLEVPNKTYDVQIADLTVSNTPGAGTFALGATSGVWTYNDAATPYTGVYPDLSPIVNGTPQAALETPYMYFIPRDYASLSATNKPSVTFKVALTQNGTIQEWYNHEGSYAHVISHEFEQGHSYILQMKWTATEDNPIPTGLDPENYLYPITFNVLDVTQYDQGETDDNAPPHPVSW